MLRAPLTLSVICLIAAGALALLSEATRDKIAEVKAQSQLGAFVTLLTRHTDLPQDLTEPQFQEINQVALQSLEQGKAVTNSAVVKRIYHLPRAAADWQEQQTPELYILQLAGRGFGGPLELFAAYRPDGSLYHAVMLDNAETPGFGKKAEDPGYMKMFWDFGSKANAELASIPTTKQELEGTQLNAVTGSTISFSAISVALLAGAEWLVQNEQ